MTFIPLFEVPVSAEDIAKGRPCSSRSCPVALAVRRNLGFSANISPYSATLIRNYTSFARFELSPATAAWIRQFDANPTNGAFTAVFGVYK